jgi:hypothetical protein
MERRDDAPLADESTGAIPNDMPEGGDPGDAPSGLPTEGEETPMGPDEAEPDGEGEPQRGIEAMPGIPEEGEADTAG